MKSPMSCHVPLRTWEPHPSVARAWGLHRDVVISFQNLWAGPPIEEPAIAAVGKDRTQEALDRACARFGDPSAPAFPSDAMLKGVVR